LELIDHMGSLIKEDGSDRGNRGGVNFQKASCTLDASVKIYSHRVDDTWSSSFRILENLSRGSSQRDEDDGEGGKHPARVGSKSVSNRLNLTATIEKNVASLNGESLDCNHSADPVFHKMSQAFDEGGAKGMLMANLVSGRT
jgi:condensin complex subunit 2